MLERALTQPQQCSIDPLSNAQAWGIPIWATKRLQIWLEKIYESLKEIGNLKGVAGQSGGSTNFRIKQLKSSFLKFESFKRFGIPSNFTYFDSCISPTDIEDIHFF